MAEVLEKERAPDEGGIASTVSLLGGEELMSGAVRNALDAHDLLEKGLPSAALLHLVDDIGLLSDEAFLTKAVGISVRTLQRWKTKSGASLSVEQSSRVWRFAEIFAHAAEVMGSKAAAEAWLIRPAIGLSRRRPIELLATSAGAEAVETYLTRLEHGVHA